MNKFLFAFCLLLIGCCPQRETVVRVDTVYVPYERVDSLWIYKTDTVHQYIAGDDHITIRIDTLWKKLWYKIKDTVVVTKLDTVVTYKEIIQEETFIEKLGRAALGALIGGVAVLFFIMFIRKT